jgi:hypothetical protein
MKLLEVLSTVMLVLALAAPAPAQNLPTDPGTDGARPELVVDEFIHDFGQVRPGRALRWAFKIRNVGNADLLILNVSHGCALTTRDYTKVIPPGQEGTVELMIRDTHAFSGVMGMSAGVSTNDSRKRNIRLMVRATFKPVLASSVLLPPAAEESHVR